MLLYVQLPLAEKRSKYTAAMEFIRNFIQNFLDKIMDIGIRHILIVRNAVFEMNK